MLEIVVALAIMIVISGAIFVAVGSSARTGGDAARIDEAAATLAQLADATARYTNLSIANPERRSFAQQIGTLATGVNAGRLSYLTTRITIADRDSCNTAYLPAEVLLWVGPFYRSPIPATGLKIAEGFFANDLMVRYNQAGVVTPNPPNPLTDAGTLAIVMPNVAFEDARALQLAVEGDQTGGANSVVRFTANGDAPVTVSYHMNIHGC